MPCTPTFPGTRGRAQKMLNSLLLLLLLHFSAGLTAQTIKGQLLDAQSEMPLIGATVEWMSAKPMRGVTNDVEGDISQEDEPSAA